MSKLNVPRRSLIIGGAALALAPAVAFASSSPDIGKPVTTPVAEATLDPRNGLTVGALQRAELTGIVEGGGGVEPRERRWIDHGIRAQEAAAIAAHHPVVHAVGQSAG